MAWAPSLDPFAAEERLKIPGTVNHPQDFNSLWMGPVRIRILSNPFTRNTRSASRPGCLTRERHPISGCVA